MVVQKSGAAHRRAQDQELPSLGQSAGVEVFPCESEGEIALDLVARHLFDGEGDREVFVQGPHPLVGLPRLVHGPESVTLGVGLPGLDQDVEFILGKISQHGLIPFGMEKMMVSNRGLLRQYTRIRAKLQVPPPQNDKNDEKAPGRGNRIPHPGEWR